MFEEGQISRSLSNAFKEVGEAAAREALKPVREEIGHLQRFASDVGPSDLGRGLQHALDRIAPLIYTTEELS